MPPFAFGSDQLVVETSQLFASFHIKLVIISAGYLPKNKIYLTLVRRCENEVFKIFPKPFIFCKELSKGPMCNIHVNIKFTQQKNPLKITS